MPYRLPMMFVSRALQVHCAQFTGRDQLADPVPEEFTMTFIKPYLIRLSHCDPTGFVFYPNYFHIFNALVEDWFYEALEIPFDVFLMQRRLSLPTVRLETTFTKPSRMGETVDFWLTVTHVGRTSLRLTMGVDKDNDQRVRMNRIAVFLSQETDRPIDIPEDVREKVLAFMRG